MPLKVLCHGRRTHPTQPRQRTFQNEPMNLGTCLRAIAVDVAVVQNSNFAFEWADARHAVIVGRSAVRTPPVCFETDSVVNCGAMYFRPFTVASRWRLCACFEQTYRLPRRALAWCAICFCRAGRSGSIFPMRSSSFLGHAGPRYKINRQHRRPLRL